MNDLDKLIEAVEAGEDAEAKSLIRRLGVADVLDPDQHGWAVSAYRGSLDASKALHDALLPGWIWQKDGGSISVQYWDDEHAHVDHNNPARAWLLAVLRAYRATQETKT